MKHSNVLPTPVVPQPSQARLDWAAKRAARQAHETARKTPPSQGLALPPRPSEQKRPVRTAKVSAPKAPDLDPRPKVSLVIDQKNWAFENIANQLVKHLGHKYRFDVQLFRQCKNVKADVAVAFWWGSLIEIIPNARPKRLVLAVYDEVSWRSGKRAGRWAKAERHGSAFVVANDSIAQGVGAGSKHLVFVTEDGVDTDLFKPSVFPAVFTAAWAGNSQCAGADDLKGVGIIRDACRLAGVPLVMADAAQGLTPHGEMPAFYGQASVYLCASRVEGTPNPVLEAAACGRPVISTDVGIVRKVVDEASGRIVERTPEAFAKALVELRDMGPEKLAQMGAQARAKALTHRWDGKMKAWDRALEAVLATPPTRTKR